MWGLRLSLVAILIQLALADFPLDIQFSNLVRDDGELSVYRLTEDILPDHYIIEITPYFEATADRDAFSFDGIVTINITVAAENLNQIIIHENVREIVTVSLTDAQGQTVDLDPVSPYERIPQYHFLKVNLIEGTALSNGQNYIIRITYVGHMNETPLTRGVFRGSYLDANGNRRWYVATHFQPTNARQAFPGFDEPGFKATFDLIINRLSTFTDTYSNMQIVYRQTIGDRVREIFQTSPRMPTYLLTFHISEEFTAIADNENPERSFRILARPNAEGQGEFAQQIGIELTEWMEDFFGVSYYSMADNMKNDQIASPDWASGATENWGLVSYRELYLLYEEGETNIQNQQTIATIVSHELAHKWFGNFITCKWWDNIWINEGFASYFEYFGVHGVRPQYELNDRFVVDYLHTSLSSDSSAATPALNNPNVYTPEQVTGHFGTITYAKGASLLRMLDNMVTTDTFKKALNYFLVDRAYQYALPEHLYAAFSRAVSEDATMSAYPELDIAEFFQTWIDEPGYPVLNVDVNMSTGELKLSQERFFLSSTATPTDQIWPIPISYTTGSNPDWTHLRPTYVMTDQSDVLTKEPGHEWVIFNVGQIGHYRVNYDEHNWEMIAQALSRDHESIHYINRAQIVDDVFALMRSNRLSFELGFEVLSFLSQETNMLVWYPAVTGLNWIRNRLLHLPQLQQFDAYLHETLNTVIASLGYEDRPDESALTKLNRFYVLSFACNTGHEECKRTAVQQFEAGNVHPNIRRHVYCEGLRNGGAEAFNTLLGLKRTNNNQANDVVLLRALGCTTEESTVNQLLQLILSDEVRAQDRVNAFTFIFMGDRNNAKIALEFVKTRHNDIREAVVGSTRFNTLLTNLAAYLDEEGLQNMESWLTAEQATIPEYAVGMSAIASSRANMAWGDQNADTISRVTGSSAIKSASSFALLAVMAVLANL